MRSAISQNSFERLEDAATAAEEKRRFDIAERLLRAALEVRRQKFGDSSAEVGPGFLKLAHLAERRHDAKRAVKFYSKALELLGDRRESAPALIALGVDAIGAKNLPQATEYFERAKNVNPDRSGLALMWVAVVKQRQNNAEEAEKLYQQALAAEGGTGPDRSVVAQVYASFLRTQGREDEAKLVARTAPPEPRQETLPAGVYRIADGTTAPKVLSKVEPEYTDAAKASGLEGTSIVSVEIWPDGRAHNPQVLRPLGLGLDENGIDAISQWQFDPGTKEGQAVKVLATIEINFRLL
jgi:TonB family protein